MSTSRHIRTCLTAAVVLAAVAACGDSTTAPAPATETRLVVQNSSSQAIVIVNFGPCTDPTWGPDRLGSTETIAPGAERAWAVSPGCYDVRARNASMGSAVWIEIQIAAGNTTRLTATSFSASVAAGAQAAGLSASEW